MPNELQQGSENAVASREETHEAIESQPSEEREGLPRGYRMRADRHYVDQLAAPSAGQPVRLLPLTQIDADGSAPQIELRPLIESIRSHGVVHPLLVRRRGSRYALVSGRKRLAAAHTLRLATVPCLVHDLDDQQAAALAAADNLTLSSAQLDAAASPLPAAVRRLIAEHLATVRKCGDVLSTGVLTLSRPVIDMVRAHSWRAGRLADALDLILNIPAPPAQDRALSAIADDVIDGFRPECRLNGVSIRGQVRDGASLTGVNTHDVQAGLVGALLAVLPLVEQMPQPTVTIKGSAGDSGSVVLEILQSDAAVSPGFARHFFDDEAGNMRPGGHAAAAGAMAAKALAERYGGAATFDVIPGAGSSLKLAFARRS